MHLKVSNNNLMSVFRCKNMKRSQLDLMKSDMICQLSNIGSALAQSRIARKMPIRANLSRNTVSRIENGDPGVAIGQILRYLDVIRPGATLSDIMSKEDSAVRAMENVKRPRRARPLSDKELEKYDF
jgi:transcriptional regulator with XRE-family HTH domain